jgi:hypothetical protein
MIRSFFSFAWVATFFRTIGGAIRTLMTVEGRQAWAMGLLAGGAMSHTVILVSVTVALKDRPGFLFWIAVGCELIISMVLFSFGSLLVKRSVVVALGEGKKIEFLDHSDAATAVAGAAVGIKPEDMA